MLIPVVSSSELEVSSGIAAQTCRLSGDWVGYPFEDRALPLPFLVEKKNRVPSEADLAAQPSLSDEYAMVRLQSRPSDNSADDALRVLFERYSKLVFSVGLRVLRDLSEAEEVVQDVFLHLYQKSGLFDPAKGRAKAWIVQLAFHRALDRRSYLAKRSFYDGTNFESLADTMSGGANPEREAGLNLDRERIRCAFAELSGRQRRTIELHFFEGLDFQEIAEALSEPLGNVRHYYYRGLDKLRKSVYVKGLGR